MKYNAYFNVLIFLIPFLSLSLSLCLRLSLSLKHTHTHLLFLSPLPRAPSCQPLRRDRPCPLVDPRRAGPARSYSRPRLRPCPPSQATGRVPRRRSCHYQTRRRPVYIVIHLHQREHTLHQNY